MKKNKQNKKISKFKFFESRLNSFIDAYATENMRYIVLLFIFLLFATVNVDNLVARIAVGLLFIIMLSSVLFVKIAKKSKFKLDVKTPYWVMVGKEFYIDIDMSLKKGFLGEWVLKIINPRNKSDLNIEKNWKFWFFDPNAAKWKGRWALKNPQVYLDREHEPVVFEDTKIFFNKKEQPITSKIKGYVKKRGVQKISNITIGKKDPLYLTQSLIDNKFTPEKIIYCIPSPRVMPEWPSNKAKKSFSVKNKKNEYLKKRILDPNGDELMGLREARKEDPLKNTHWKTLAKTGKRFVMDREDRLPVKMSLLVDPVLSSDSYAEERFEQMLEMIIGQALNTHSKKDIDWLLLDKEPISINNKKHWEDLYKKIALLQPLSEVEVKEEWDSLHSYWKRVAALRVITTRNENELKEWINYWKKSGIYIEIIKVPYVNEKDDNGK